MKNMKIRTGFVSNSSSSSFLIYGVFLESEQAERLQDKIDSLWKEKCGLEDHSPEYADGVYVGMSWDSIRDDETGAQFKARVETLLDDKLESGIGAMATTHSEAWYNG